VARSRLILFVAIAGCGAPPEPIPDAGTDAGVAEDAGAVCTSDDDCADATFCDGVERCAPLDPAADALGCLAASSVPCLAGQTCDEAADRCLTECDIAGDADDDGHDAPECGGDDCDDADATRSPSAAEECNARDDDCDGSLGAIEDGDGDGHASLACGGDDCDDGDSGVFQGAVDACDGIDADCDGVVEDADGDGYLASGATCAGGPLLSGDCDDAEALVNPGATEECDGIDQNCGGGIDEGADLTCTVMRGTASCVDGACAVASCDDGWADCNGLPVDGCEADLASPRYCNGCAGELCAVACVGGACDPVVQMAAASGTTYAVRASGRVTEWGVRTGGTVADIAGIDDGVFVETSYSHACVVREGGVMLCFGRNGSGELGDGTNQGADPGTLFRWAPTLDDGVRVACGTGFTCAVRRSGEVWCWGRNDFGQLGRGTRSTFVATPGPVGGLTDAVAIAATPGSGTTCAVEGDGTVWCWGRGSLGQLGNGTTTFSTVPVQVTGMTGAVAIAMGDHHACVVRGDGTVACWGSNLAGQLGDGTNINRSTYVDVAGIDDAIGVDASQVHTCILRSGGVAQCWGLNGDELILGDGATDWERFAPGPPVPLANVDEVVTGYQYGCARNVDGIWCWGDNYMLQLANGTTVDPQAVPALVQP
jgi:hypothetical protein